MTDHCSEVAARKDVELKTFEQRRDVLNIDLGSATFRECRRRLLVWVSRRWTVELFVTDEQQLATTRPTHWV